MTGARAGLGVLALALLVAAPTAAAWRLCRRRVPRLRGPHGVLGTAVLAPALLFAVAQVLGAVGWFRLAPLVVGVGAASAAVWYAAGRTATPAAPEKTKAHDAAADDDRSATLVRGLVVPVVGAVTAVWAWVAAQSFRDGGIFEFDSINYHLTFAAHFVKDGWVTRLSYVSVDPTHAFHPLDGELLQAITMLSVGSDALVWTLNVCWMGLLLLAGWCLADKWKAGPLGLLAAAVICASPIFVVTQPGTANTDIVALAFLVAALALLAQADGDAGVLTVAGVAAGLSLSSKLTVLAPVGLVCIALLFAYRRRPRVLAGWFIALFATGSFWYFRNLFRTGNPLPNLGILPSPDFPLIDRFGSSSLLQYATKIDVLRDSIIPAFRVLGVAPVAVIGLAMAGALAAILLGPTRLRLLGVLAGVLVVSYAATPMTGYGPKNAPYEFVVASNTRYLLPALLLGMIAGVAAVRGRWRWGALAAAAWLATIAVLEIARTPGLVRGHFTTACAGAVIALALMLVVVRLRSRLTPTLLAAMAAATVLIAAGGLAARSGHYIDDWYRSYGDSSLASVWRAVSGGHGRVGVHAIELDYPFAGPSEENHVEWILVRVANGGVREPGSCTEWRSTVNHLRLDWVVVSDREPSSLGFGLPQAVGWTSTDPAAHLVVTSGGLSAFRLDGPMDPAACPP